MVQDLSMFLKLFRFLGGQGKTEARPDVSHDVDEQQTHQGGLLQREAKYAIGDVLRHRIHPFRGVVFDIDPEFSNTEEWYESIPKGMRPRRDQPYYHLFAENDTSHYVAYVSEQNLVPDENIDPVSHPDIVDVFDYSETGYALKQSHTN